MKSKLPAEERASANIKLLKNQLRTSMTTLSQIKEYWLKVKRFEDVVRLKDLEKLLEKCQKDFVKLTNATS